MKLEFITLESAGKEAEWLRNFLSRIPLGMQSTPSVSMHCDSQAAILIVKNKSFNGKNKHIHLKHEVMKQLLKYRIIFINYVKLEVNLADPLTKPLRRKLIFETSSGMGLNPIRD